MRRRWLGIAGAILAIPAAPLVAPWASTGHAAEFQAPRYTRAQMEAALAERREALLVIYGTADSVATPVLRERARVLAQRLFGGDSSRAITDRAVPAETLAVRSLVLVGGPSANLVTRRLAPGLPVTFGRGSFRWQGREYDRPGDAIHLVYPHPLAPRHFVLLLAANSTAALARRGGGFLFGSEDWRITRNGELVRSGVFAQSPREPWRYDPALDRDRERDREQYAARLVSDSAGAIRVRAPAPLKALSASTAASSRALLARLDRMGFPAPPRPATLTLYTSLESKGRLARNTRPEHLDDAGEAHAAPAAGRARLDLWSVAAQRLRASGASAVSPYLEPAGVWLAGSCEGEPLERALARLYFGRVLPTAADAAARDVEWRSPLITVPARALLARTFFECGGARGRDALRPLLAASPPGTLDSLCRAAGLSSARVRARYAALGDSLARLGQRMAGRAPRAWRPADDFIRGVCVAHSVSLEGGYLSAGCARELQRLAAAGANAISLTPFGYLASPTDPEIFLSASGGPEEENDESVCEAGARAKGLGLRVWLKPHLWTRGGWVGELNFTPSGWNRFFDRYRAMALHYALLAEREGFDGFLVGHELVTATLRHPDRWRALIAEVRRIYTGTLSYGANWGDEVGGIAFWDALDLISVSFYTPLADKPTRSGDALQAGAARALRDVRSVGARWRRPVLLSEVGYAPTAGAPVRPWEEREGPIDLEAQRACYEAVLRALEPELWVAGAFWWKWFSSDVGGPVDPSFSPRGKPAESVMDRALTEWQGRPVRVPEAPAPDRK